MPATEKDLFDWMCRFSPHGSVRKTVAVIEQVGGFVGSEGKGGGAANGAAMFKFGMSYGGLRMALVGCGIPFEAATPGKWLKGLGVVGRKKEESRTEWKNRLKAAAQRLFPSEKVTLNTADALLIAEFCRRCHTGRIQTNLFPAGAREGE